jgi:hypothetical protein
MRPDSENKDNGYMAVLEFEQWGRPRDIALIRKICYDFSMYESGTE